MPAAAHGDCALVGTAPQDWWLGPYFYPDGTEQHRHFVMQYTFETHRHTQANPDGYWQQSQSYDVYVYTYLSGQLLSVDFLSGTAGWESCAGV